MNDGIYGTDYPEPFDPGPHGNPTIPELPDGEWAPSDEEARDAELEQQLAFNREVSGELNRLRIREEARRRWALEQHPLEDYAQLYLDADQLDQLPVADPLIDRVLSRQSYAILRGRDHTFKSFVALDWSWCLATGKKWQARDVEQVRVLYIVGEGAYGLRQRKQAWEAAWKTKIPANQWAIRRQALDMHNGGPALDELLDRVHAGRYGLVVVDTLRRVSGRAEGNGSDMGAVVDTLTRLREATDNGSVLVLAHTDKNDTDSRGYSGIEDDADIIWHAKRPKDGPAMALDLDCTKMKDGPDSERIELTMSPVLDSLVVSKYARHGTGAHAPIENYDTDDSVLEAMRDTFARTGASIGQLIEVTGLSRSTAYKARGRLLASGQLIMARKGGTDYLYLPGTTVESGVESPWNPPPDSTPVHGDRSTPVHTAVEHESTAVHGSPHPESTPVHTPPPVLETGVAWNPAVDTADEEAS
jgi:hypothetical protein